MKKVSLIQQALGQEWHGLPKALRNHYISHELIDEGICSETGYLDIHYPLWMQPVLSILGWFGVLINRRAEVVNTTVKKWMEGEQQHWIRSMRFVDGTTRYFKSYLVAAGDNQVIEYVNPFLGLQMSVSVQDQKVIYHGVNYVLKLGSKRIKIPSALALGQCHIEESAIDDEQFHMNFTLVHPVFGQIFQYKGIFRTCVAT